MHWRCLQLTLAAPRKTELIVCSGLSVHSVTMILFCDAWQQVRFPYSDSRLSHVQMSQTFIFCAFALCSTMPSSAYTRCHACQEFFGPLSGSHDAGGAGRLTRHYRTLNDLYASELKAVSDSTSDFVRTFLGTRTRVFGAVFEATNVTYRCPRCR